MSLPRSPSPVTLTGPGRDPLLQLLREPDRRWDLIIVGGGITGAGLLREATRRGLKALLVEQQDFAWGTSSRSSKMVHGGLRYLGSGQYRLTRDSVRERERLMREAPGLVDRLPFLMPHYKGVFPGPRLFNLLLAIYDWIAGRRDHAYQKGDRALMWAPGLNRKGLLGGTCFADAVTDDARLVLRVLDESVRRGGVAINYLAATEVTREQGKVSGLKLRDAVTGETFVVRTGAVINGTGAWADHLRPGGNTEHAIRPLRGSHLIFPAWRLPVSLAVSFFHPGDRRPVFVFPWEGVTVVGTTDLDHPEGLDREASITEEEIDYLLDAANRVFPAAGLRREHIQGSWSGVRPVVGSGDKDPSSEKREHVIWDDQGLVTVAGGKLTTFRLIAREVLTEAAPHLPATSETGDPVPAFTPPPQLERPAGVSALQWQRLQGYYGAQLPAVLAAGPIQPVSDTGVLLCELSWAAAFEAVEHLDDLLLRRTRLGLLLPAGGETELETIRAHCQPALGWDDARWHLEVERYRGIWRRHYSVPGAGEARV